MILPRDPTEPDYNTYITVIEYFSKLSENINSLNKREFARKSLEHEIEVLNKKNTRRSAKQGFIKTKKIFETDWSTFNRKLKKDNHIFGRKTAAIKLVLIFLKTSGGICGLKK